MRGAGGVEGVAECTTVTTLLDVIIGSVTFSGSIIAAGKLQGVITSAPVTFRGARAVNLLLAALGLGAAGYVISTPGLPALWIVIVAALVFGVSMVMPIGGPDMPGVFSLLNAFTRTVGAPTFRGRAGVPGKCTWCWRRVSCRTRSPRRWKRSTRGSPAPRGPW